MNEPQWLQIAKQLQAISQAGLAYAQDPFDKERFEEVRRISAEITAHHTDFSAEKIDTLFAKEVGYPCPKIGCRAAVFNDKGEVLMVEELAENKKWTFPGGFCDIGDGPRAAIEREVWEETGYVVRATKLIAIHNRNHLPDVPPRFNELYNMLFLCELVGGEAKTSIETGRSAFYTQDTIPANTSFRRTHPVLRELAFAHYADPSLPTEFN
ncbi:MAG: NUDIX hydrolase [Candidatus Promineifilaceae bacterium]